jgi:hypothetical protein
VWAFEEAERRKREVAAYIMAQTPSLEEQYPINSVIRICDAFEKSVEFSEFRPKTQETYTYHLKSVVEAFARFPIQKLDTKAIKDWLHATRKVNGWTAKHRGEVLLALFKWVVSEGIIRDVDRPKIINKVMPSREVIWTPEQIVRQADQLEADGWLSLCTGFLVSWCVGQNPIDIWTIPRAVYDPIAKTLDITRTKTGEGGAPIPLWGDISLTLDRYLSVYPCGPNDPLFRHEQIGGAWHEQTRLKWFREARGAAELPFELQMRDVRRTAITEGDECGLSIAEIRSVSRHASEAGMKPYRVLHRKGEAVAKVQAARDELRKTRGGERVAKLAVVK